LWLRADRAFVIPSGVEGYTFQMKAKNSSTEFMPSGVEVLGVTDYSISNVQIPIAGSCLLSLREGVKRLKRSRLIRKPRIQRLLHRAKDLFAMTIRGNPAAEKACTEHFDSAQY